MKTFIINGVIETRCPLCTGSHYLSDMPELGPCICCNPEALTRAENALEATTHISLDAQHALNKALDGIVKIRAAFADMLVNTLGMEANPVTIEEHYLASLADLIDQWGGHDEADPEEYRKHKYGAALYKIVKQWATVYVPMPAAICNEVMDVLKAVEEEPE